MDSTLKYYNQNADQFVQGTLSVDFKQTQDRFLAKLPEDAYILDFGCGSGRDTKYFLENGYQVDAADGSEELCKIILESRLNKCFLESCAMLISMMASGHVRPYFIYQKIL